MRFDTALLIAVLALPAHAAGPGEVKWKGTLRAVHGGDASPNLELAALEPREHLYAVGPLAHSAGEITIIDGTPHVVKVANGTLATSHDLSGAASFLVWAQVPRWSPPAALDRPPGGARTLDELVEAAATRAGLDTSRPFPFLLTGAFTAVDLHVIAPPGATAPAHGAHGGGSALRLHLAGIRGTALGFFSRAHEGVFTHRGERTHVHFVAADGRSGHADALEPGAGVEISFPAR